MRRSADDTLSIALCASLIIHVAVMFAAFETRVRELEPHLTRPAWTAQERQLLAHGTGTNTAGPPLLQPPPPQPPIPQFDLPKPEVTKTPEPQPPKPHIPLNSEWGERDGKGIAINSAPGEQPLSAPKGPADQSFGSRDPAGPATEFPPEPSMSTIPPGESGDGKRPLQNALGTLEPEGAPMITLAPPPPSTPPTIALNTPQPSIGLSPLLRPDHPTSATPTAPREAPPLTPTNSSTQLLPQGNPDLIAIPSTDPTLWPAITEALTAPPHASAGSQAMARILAQGLPDLATPHDPTLEEPQPAIASLIPSIESPDPTDLPTIVEALLHPPALESTEGVAATLPDLTTPATPGSAETQDAIVAMLPADPAPELALPIDNRPVPPNDQTLTLNTLPPATLVPTGPVASAVSATGAAPGPPVPPADPAADTGLESDPFAKVPGVRYRNGQVDARSGRQVKPVRPRLTEAARRDLLSLQFPTILLKVRIDPTGKVQDVKVVRGSGSEAIDMPVYRAMWQWWFEPPKDKQGNPQPDTQLVAIHWG